MLHFGKRLTRGSSNRTISSARDGKMGKPLDRSSSTGLPAGGIERTESHNGYAGCYPKTAGTQLGVRLVAVAIFLSGLVSILQVLLTRFPHHPRLYGVLLPFGVFHISRTLNLTLGFILIYLSLRLLQRRRVAWWAVVAVTSVVFVTHFGQHRLWYTAVAPALTLVVLFLYRKSFTVRSEPRGIRQGLALLGLCVAVGVCYGTFGFWLLDKRDFGIDFSILDAITRTLRELSLTGNSDLTPVSRHARWFLDSLRVLSIVSLCFAAYSIFRPVTYEVIILPGERARARQIVAEFGRSSYDYFKTWADKSYYFSATGRSFLCYRTLMGVAVCLGDPLGPEDEIERVTVSFLRFCIDNGWQVVFLMPELTTLYEHLGLPLLKIAESAVVDLKDFCERTSKKKYFRYIRRKLDGEGFHLVGQEPPHSQELLDEVEEVSKEWLGLSGHREFGFLEGSFTREYLSRTPLTVLRGPDGKAVAFVNEIPSYRSGEATIDLMRHRPGVHWAAMDYIFMVLMQELWQKGYKSFYLGLAGIADNPGPTIIEKAIYQISTHINWLVHAKGVRQYKEKFEPTWEDRYLAYYRTPLSLTKIALALTRVL
jgi:phosphatidylglycerol lysyltransferase